MRETGIGTSLMLIAVGAVLAFAVEVQSSAVDLNAIGLILIVVGIIGLLFSVLALGQYSMGRRPTEYVEGVRTPTSQVRPSGETTEVVYEEEPTTTVIEERPARVEKVRRIRR